MESEYPSRCVGPLSWPNPGCKQTTIKQTQSRHRQPSKYLSEQLRGSVFEVLSKRPPPMLREQREAARLRSADPRSTILAIPKYPGKKHLPQHRRRWSNEPCSKYFDQDIPTTPIKQMPCESGFSAVGRPNFLASLRTSGFAYSPSGKRQCFSCF